MSIMKREPVIAAALLAALAAVNYSQMRFLPMAAEYRDLLQLRRLAYAGEPLSAPAVDDALRRSDAIVASCNHDGIIALVDLLTWQADKITPSENREAWLEKLRRIDDVSVKGLQCEPTNGFLWARLAFVRWFLGRPATEQAMLLGYSQSYAPSEMPAITARMAQWKRVSSAVLDLAHGHAEADIRTILNYAQPGTAFAQLSDLPPALADMLKTQLPLVSPERLEALLKIPGADKIFIAE
ncbi:hypothetical protein [Rhizobium sp. SGZ-381]|uniref:hypothetical protein n=1 Tax=Rhizobium sp. SGZ-381 TaxID=3342800 RepID=UPI00366CBD7A